LLQAYPVQACTAVKTSPVMYQLTTQD